YLGKEGWAPASYLKKAKDDLPSRKKNLTGPVEIIGNIMEITSESHITKKEISLPILCSDSNGNAMMTPDKQASKLAQGSPAIARIAPQRAQISSPNLRTRPPPRRESSLGFQLPKPPEPPSVEVEYYTIAEFQSCISDGISFRGGQKAEVIEKNSGGWWYVQIGEKEGWAPASYIDKRKKPNLNRRTSTLTRPKVPPPAPPSKPKDTEEGTIPGTVSSGEAQDSPHKLKYEEPEYDVPAFGFDSECDVNESHREESTPEKRLFQPLKQPVSSLQKTKFKVGESSEDVAHEEETIYENEGFRRYAEDALSNKESSGDSDSQKSASLSLIRRNSPCSSSPKTSLVKPKTDKNIHPDLGKCHYSRNEETKPRSASDVGLRSMPRTGVKKEPGQSPSIRAKPIVRPKPFLNKAESQSQEKMDISTLRRQLRPTGQLRGGLKGSRSEESESPPYTASENQEDPVRRSSADLITAPSRGMFCSSHQAKTEHENDSRSFYVTTDSYQKVQDSEIGFPAGVEVEVLEKQASGWWYLKYGDAEGWAPSHYLALADNRETTATDTDASLSKNRKNENKSNSLEKIEKRVQALNTINQSKRATPPIPSKPPGGFSKTSGPVKMRNGVRQLAVRPQSVFVSPPPKENNLSCSLRRNESLTSTDHLRNVRRNSSFSNARSQPGDSKGKQAERSGTEGLETTSNLPSQRNGIPVSTVRPKPIEKSQFIHNNLKDIYVSIADYEGDEETAGFQEGVCMEVLERNPNGWWYCQIMNGVKPFKGWVPSNYLEKKN
ncbi:PREDICTED: SH3 and PX domain-containing protein 2A, partial [Tinamus guttatus]|uniref:SH3 and PX domain-containing protein 2A n=1 Tax=Tinamus guttatus TaxID=94827 RepID=UPI00052F0868